MTKTFSRAKREVEMYIQKEDYLQKMIRQQTENMKKMEEELSAWEQKMVQRVSYLLGSVSVNLLNNH